MGPPGPRRRVRRPGRGQGRPRRGGSGRLRTRPPGGDALSADAPLVLHVLEALEGGTARHVTDVVTHAPGVRHVVAVPARRVGGVTDERARPAIEAAGGRVVTVDMRRSPASWHNAVALGRLRRLVRDLQPSIVHSHSTVGGALGRMAATGRAARVYTPNGFNPSLPFVLAERALRPLTDVLVAVSPSEADDLRRAGLARRSRLVTIPNGIDLDVDPPAAGDGPDLRAILGLAPGTRLVGTIARLVPQKAPERFVAVAARCAQQRPDVHFVLIGSGRLGKLVDRRVHELGIGDRFHRIPVLPGAARALDQLDVFCLPSRFEGGAYTPLEAMRAGVPVVLSDAVGNRDVVEPGVSGLIARGDDTGALASAVLRLLDDPAAAQKMAAAARARLAERFDVRAMGAALAGLYAELARR